MAHLLSFCPSGRLSCTGTGMGTKTGTKTGTGTGTESRWIWVLKRPRVPKRGRYVDEKQQLLEVSMHHMWQMLILFSSNVLSSNSLYQQILESSKWITISEAFWLLCVQAPLINIPPSCSTNPKFLNFWSSKSFFSFIQSLSSKDFRHFNHQKELAFYNIQGNVKTEQTPSHK